MNEHQLRAKASKFFKDRPGWYAQKISDRFTSGIPDYLCCYKGYFVAIELKALGQEPTALQKAAGSRINKAGGKWVVIDNFNMLEKWVKWVEGYYIPRHG